MIYEESNGQLHQFGCAVRCSVSFLSDGTGFAPMGDNENIGKPVAARGIDPSPADPAIMARLGDHRPAKHRGQWNIMPKF